MSMYAVRKRQGAWTICDDQKLLMLLDSYEEAIEVAQTAAVIMIETAQGLAPDVGCRITWKRCLLTYRPRQVLTQLAKEDDAELKRQER